jgi:secretion/DNA translocation related CpaE-like protein
VEPDDERPARPLIVTADESLLDDLLRLAAAAGTVPEVASDVAAARRSWAAAGVVVVGADLASAVAEVQLPRREGVVLASARGTEAWMWAHAVALGAGEVVTLPEGQGALIDAFGDCLDGGAGGGTTVSVLGACGGSGSSTFAAALAVSGATSRVAHGRGALVVDADPLGGGLDLVLGAEDRPGVRWPELAHTSGRLSASTLREALPRSRDLSILSWDRGDPVEVGPAAMRSVLTAGQRGHGLVVVDLPRHLDAAAEEAVVRSAVTLLVVPAEVRAVAAASRVLAQVRPLAPRLALVVRVPGPGGLGADQVAESLGVQPWAQMRPDKGVGPAIDEGLGPLRRRKGPLALSCRQVLERLGASSAAAA